MGLDIRIRDLQLHHIPDSHLTAEIRAGELVGITGANGAGKTEFLRLIAGLLRPKTMGEIVIDGFDPFHGRDLEKLHRRIGFLQQSPKDTMVFSQMIQDAPFGPENQAVESDVIRKRWEGLRGRLLKDIPERQAFDTLSGGQQQKAALMSVLMLRSQVLLLDEPFSMLGKAEGREVLKLILRLAKRNQQTVLLVSHDPWVLKHMDRVFLLKDGMLREKRGKKRSVEVSGTGSESGIGATEELRGDGTGITASASEAGAQEPGPVNPLEQFTTVQEFPAGTEAKNGKLSWVIRKRPTSQRLLLRMSGVTAGYGRNMVIRDFSAVVCPGGYYEISGGIGSGKSTLCKLMNGTQFASSGEICVASRKEAAGEAMLRLPLAGEKRKRWFKSEGPSLAEVRRIVGYAMQSPEDQLFETSVIFDVMYGPLRAGRTAIEARQDAEAALRELQVPESVWERKPETLSRGEQRRVAIAGILAVRPEVLVLDEPFAGLDEAGCEVIRNMIENYVNQDRAVVVTTHAC